MKRFSLFFLCLMPFMSGNVFADKAVDTGKLTVSVSWIAGTCVVTAGEEANPDNVIIESDGTTNNTGFITMGPYVFANDFPDGYTKFEPLYIAFSDCQGQTSASYTLSGTDVVSGDSTVYPMNSDSENFSNVGLVVSTAGDTSGLLSNPMSEARLVDLTNGNGSDQLFVAYHIFGDSTALVGETGAKAGINITVSYE